MRALAYLDYAFEHVQTGLSIVDDKGIILRTNPAGAAIVGRTVEELTGTSFAPLVHPDDVEQAFSELARGIATGTAGPVDVRGLRPDGAVVWLRCYAIALPDGHMFVIFEDVAEQRAAAEHLAHVNANLLAEHAEVVRRGQVLADLAALPVAAGLDGLIDRVTELAVEHLAPLASVVLVEADEIRVANIHHRDAEVEALLRRSVADLGSGPLLGQVGDAIARGEPALLDDGPFHPALHERLAEFNERFPPGDRLVVPMLTDSGAEGALVLVRHRDDAGFTTADRDLASVVAARAALAVRNVRLDQWRNAAERATARRAAQQSAVAELGRAALAGSSVHDLADQAAKLGAETLGVTYCGVLLDDGDPDGPLLVAATEPFTYAVGEYRRVRDESLATVLSRSSTTLVDDLGDVREDEAPTDFLTTHGMRSLAVTPIVPNSSPPGVLVAGATEPRAFGPDDTTFLETMANVLASAIDARQALDDLRHNALHDALTGLPNRTLLLDRLELALDQASGHATQVAVLVCDLDRFKVVNDGLGHAAGDEVLRLVAQRLRALIRPGDTVGRFGGDEFVVVCPDVTDLATVVAIADRLAEGFREPMQILGTDLVTTASIGIVLGHDVGPESAATLLRDADAAMYRAKARGRGRYELFDDDMRARASSRLLVESELRRAIEHDELVLHYQPVISVTDGALIGVEALVRWEHPERGLIPPLDFLGVADESGLMPDLGVWVFREAARQAVRWQADGVWRGVWTAINVSPRQLSDPHLLERIDPVLAEPGVDPDLLRVEITEDALVEDPVQTGGVLDALRERGLRISVDDFGTGYSSLAYVKRLPIDALKLDQGFVAGLEEDGDDMVISAAVIVMAQALGLTVVAEGVETQVQLEVLRAMGCDLAQGFLFTCPLPADELERWWADRVALGVQ